jgi:hypothetical protein
MKKLLLLVFSSLLTSCANIYDAYRGHNLEVFGELKHMEVTKYVRDRAGNYTKTTEHVPYVIDGKLSCFENSQISKDEYIITVPWSIADDVQKILTVSKGNWNIEKRSPNSEILFEGHQVMTAKYERANCSYNTLWSLFLNKSYWYTSLKLPKAD